MSTQEARSYLKELNAKEKQLKKINKKFRKLGKIYTKIALDYNKIYEKRINLVDDINRLKRDIEV